MKYFSISFLAGLVLMGMSLPQNVHGGDQANSFWSYRSFDMGVTNRGLSAGATWKHPYSRIWSSPFQFSFLFYNESDKIPQYNPYDGNYYKPPSKKILFLNLRTGIQRRVWADDIAPTVQPFLFGSAGPSLAFDPANNGGFFDRWEQTTLSYTIHGFAGAGVDFVYSRRSAFSVSVGYEVMYFPVTVDGTNNYSGVAVVLSFGERL